MNHRMYIIKTKHDEYITANGDESPLLQDAKLFHSEGGAQSHINRLNFWPSQQNKKMYVVPVIVAFTELKQGE